MARSRPTCIAVALATGMTLTAAAPAAANLTDAIDGYRLEPAERLVLDDRASVESAGLEDAPWARDVIEQALRQDNVSAAEQELRDAGIDTDKLRDAVERSLDGLGS